MQNAQNIQVASNWCAYALQMSSIAIPHSFRLTCELKQTLSMEEVLVCFCASPKQLNLINEILIYNFAWLQTQQIAGAVEVKLGLKFYFTYGF